MNLLLVVLLSMVATARRAQGQGDSTRVPEAKGSGVVIATINLIDAQCIFDEDKLLFRRIAYVETIDGLQQDTFRDGYYGGIWKVDQAMFDKTQEANVSTNVTASIAAIQSSFNITWSAVVWQDLTKSLHSALAARLYLQSKNGTTIPRPISDQATYWKTYYRPTGDEDYFTSTTSKLDQVCSNANGADLVFLLDESGSIGAPNFALIRDFVNATAAAFEVGTKDSQNRIGVIKFATDVTNVFFLKTHTTNAAVAAAINAMTYGAGGTATDIGLDYMRKTAFTEANGARDINSFPRVGIVVTDGASNNPPLTTASAQAARDAGITLIAVGVGTGINMDELEAIASEPYCQNLLILSTFAEFNSLKDAIQQKACETGITLTAGSNTTTNVDLPPGASQNFKMQIPDEGVTVRLETDGGSTTLYTAQGTYPSPEYHQQMAMSRPGRPGVLFIPQPLTRAADSIVFCSVKGDSETETNINISSKLGDQDHCQPQPCQNQGECIDTDTSYRCECPTDVIGDHCETKLPSPPPAAAQHNVMYPATLLICMAVVSLRLRYISCM